MGSWMDTLEYIGRVRGAQQAAQQRQDAQIAANNAAGVAMQREDFDREQARKDMLAEKAGALGMEAGPDVDPRLQELADMGARATQMATAEARRKAAEAQALEGIKQYGLDSRAQMASDAQRYIADRYANSRLAAAKVRGAGGGGGMPPYLYGINAGLNAAKVKLAAAHADAVRFDKMAGDPEAQVMFPGFKQARDEALRRYQAAEGEVNAYLNQIQGPEAAAARMEVEKIKRGIYPAVAGPDEGEEPPLPGEGDTSIDPDIYGMRR